MRSTTTPTKTLATLAATTVIGWTTVALLGCSARYSVTESEGPEASVAESPGMFSEDADSRAVAEAGASGVDTDAEAMATADAGFVDAGTPPIKCDVNANPGDDLQALIDANPAGTGFCLAAGVYRNQELTPKAGDGFLGVAGTVVNGANLIAAPVKSGSLWYAAGQTQQGNPGNVHSQFCEPGYPKCNQAEVLYFDDKPFVGVGSIGAVKAGTFFFDYVADRVYFADDPTGHKVEVGATGRAFGGKAANVTIANLTVEKYAQFAQQGTIEMSTGWHVDNVTVQLNGGQGITMLGDGATVANSRVLRNGQIGIGANGNADGVVDYGHSQYAIFVTNTEIAFNNSNHYESGWEAGGTKFWATKNAVISGNNVHHNRGPGLWTDGFNENTTFSGNFSHDNDGTGIFHEISGSAKIINNTVTNNGLAFFNETGIGQPNTCWAGICISSGKNVEISGNRLTNNVFGVVVMDDMHYPDPTYGISIHDNMTVSTKIQAVVLSAPGYVANGGSIRKFPVDKNQYAPGMLFGFEGAARPWSEWRAAGFDLNGMLNQ